MKELRLWKRGTAAIALAAYMPVAAVAGDVLSSSGFTNCLNNATITVQTANVQFDRTSLTVTFDVAGTSSTEQKVTAELVVTAYGNQVYSKSFNPCDPATLVSELCPGMYLYCDLSLF